MIRLNQSKGTAFDFLQLSKISTSSWELLIWDFTLNQLPKQETVVFISRRLFPRTCSRMWGCPEPSFYKGVLTFKELCKGEMLEDAKEFGYSCRLPSLPAQLKQGAQVLESSPGQGCWRTMPCARHGFQVLSLSSFWKQPCWTTHIWLLSQTSKSPFSKYSVLWF